MAKQEAAAVGDQLRLAVLGTTEGSGSIRPLSSPPVGLVFTVALRLRSEGEVRMKGTQRVLETLNELLALELAAVHQYFVHSKMCENWGYDRLAHHFRETSLEEMKDGEEIIHRILFLEGAPKMAPLAVTIGGNVIEQLRADLETEKGAIKLLHEGIAASLEDADQASREFFASRLPDEEGHADWLETQLSLIAEIGADNYLAQQIRE